MRCYSWTSIRSYLLTVYWLLREVTSFLKFIIHKINIIPFFYTRKYQLFCYFVGIRQYFFGHLKVETLSFIITFYSIQNYVINKIFRLILNLSDYAMNLFALVFNGQCWLKSYGIINNVIIAMFMKNKLSYCITIKVK